MGSLLDWRNAGVDLKVELATSGSLVYPIKSNKFTLDPGGPEGAPLGWVPGVINNLAPTSSYNFTTSGGIASISNKTTASAYSAHVISPSWVPVANRRYRLRVQARIMQGKGTTERYPQIERSSNNGSSWSYYTAPNAQAGTPYPTWENINAFGNPVAATVTHMRVKLNGSLEIGTSGALYGMQYQNLYVDEVDTSGAVTGTLSFTWADITCDVQSLIIRHGRERFTNRYDVGTLQMQLLDDKGTYQFSEDHPLGLTPGRPVKVTATYEGTTYPQFYGLLDNIGQRYNLDGHVYTTFTVLDATSLLGNTQTQSGVDAVPSASERIEEISDQAGYPFRRIDPDATDPWAVGMQGLTQSGRSLRDEAGITADTEGGSFFGDREGYFVYKNRDWIKTDPLVKTVQADIVAMPHPGDGPMWIPDGMPTVPDAPLICNSEFQTSWSLDRVMNIVILGNAGSTPQTFTDQPSMNKYGPRTYQRLDFIGYGGGGDNFLPYRAADLMTGYLDPVLRVDSLSFNTKVQSKPDIFWPFLLRAFLNWMIRVWYSQPVEEWGFAVCTHIQAITHTITPREWSVQMNVDVPQAFTEFRLGQGGWDSGLWDINIWDQESDDVIEGSGAYWNSGQKWNADSTIWFGRGQWGGIAKWSNPPDDWKP